MTIIQTSGICSLGTQNNVFPFCAKLAARINYGTGGREGEGALFLKFRIRSSLSFSFSINQKIHPQGLNLSKGIMGEKSGWVGTKEED